MKRKLTKTEKFLIITVILVAALYFYVNKFYDPAMTKLNNSRQSAVALQSEINQLGGYGGEMMLEKKVNNLHKEVDKLNKEVTDLSASKKAENQVETTTLATRLASLIPQGVRDLNELLFKEELEVAKSLNKPEDAFPWREYNCSMEGSYSELVSYLGLLARMNEVVVIKNIHLKEKSEGYIYTLSFTLLI
ncbi:MAG: hypothetical protein RQM95_11295 [Syntrophaceticus schinkii]